MKGRKAHIRVSMVPARSKEDWLAIALKVSQEASPLYRL